MDLKAFSVRQILAGEAPDDAPVTVKGWVRTRRDSRAGISFVHMSDGFRRPPKGNRLRCRLVQLG
jgi:aspartyl/asparaginyl-tRNA synthetase